MLTTKANDYDTGYKWVIVLYNGTHIYQGKGFKVSDIDPEEIRKFLLIGENTLSIDVDDEELIYFCRVIRSLAGDLEKVTVFFGTRTILYEIDPVSDTYKIHTDNISDVLKGSAGCYGEIDTTYQGLTPEQ